MRSKLKLSTCSLQHCKNLMAVAMPHKHTNLAEVHEQQNPAPPGHALLLQTRLSLPVQRIAVAAWCGPSAGTF